jgi:hypothetical protein
MPWLLPALLDLAMDVAGFLGRHLQGSRGNKRQEQVEIGILQGKLMYPIRADKPYQTIASDDIGGFVALAFGRPKESIGLELEIAGSDLTSPQAAEI